MKPAGIMKGLSKIGGLFGPLLKSRGLPALRNTRWMHYAVAAALFAGLVWT
jgi:hypothetical protein